MILNKRGISLNKNALNIQQNQNPLDPIKAALNTQQNENPLESIKGALNTQRNQNLLDPIKGALNTQQNQNLVDPIKKLTQLDFKRFNTIISDENHSQPTVKPSMIPVPTDKLPDKLTEIEDIDKSDSRDAMFLVCDIAKDIYEYMYELEAKQSVKEDYLKDQKILTPKVRHRLVNWCIEIHQRLKLLQETLYMTISLIDRYFELVQVKQQSLVQLVAVGATLIASKYEEIYPPDVGDLIHLTQNSYSKNDIFNIEINILQTLNFNLGKPIPLAFLRRFSKANHSDLKLHSIAKHLMELSLTEYECCHWKPSLLAAAALFTSIHLVHQDTSPPGTLTRRFGTTRSINLTQPIPSALTLSSSSLQTDRWNKTLVHYTHYSRKDLLEPAGVLCKILKKSQKNPLSYFVVKKNQASLLKWPELKSTRVDQLIKLGDKTQ